MTMILKFKLNTSSYCSHRRDRTNSILYILLECIMSHMIYCFKISRIKLIETFLPPLIYIEKIIKKKLTKFQQLNPLVLKNMRNKGFVFANLEFIEKKKTSIPNIQKCHTNGLFLKINIL